jgi:hypothetical protein
MDERRLYEELSKRLDDFRTDVNARFGDVNGRFDELRTDMNARFDELRSDVNTRIDESNRRSNNMQMTMIVGGITILAAVIGLSFA